MAKYKFFADSSIEQLINNVYGGVVTREALPQDLYEAILDRLTEGVIEGFGSPIIDAKRGKVYDGFVKNLSVFSAAKTYQQINDMSNFLFDENGNKNPFSFFKEKANGIFETYNKTWLETEYNTAISQAQAADKWLDIKENEDIFPLLKYVTAGDGRVRPVHNDLDGIIRPVNDPFWDKYLTPNGFGCRCNEIQLEEGEITDLTGRDFESVSPLFQMNAGKDRFVFNEKAHPYLRVADKYKIESNLKKRVVTPPIKKAIKKVEKTEAKFAFKNLTQARAGLSEFIERSSPLKIDRVMFSTSLNIESVNKRVNALADLFNTYRLSDTRSGELKTKITLKSTKSFYGVVRSFVRRSEKKSYIKEINIGDSVSTDYQRLRVKGADKLRFKSSVDPDKYDLVTTVHEFAHVITTQEMRTLSDLDGKFFNELANVRTKYDTELRTIRDLDRDNWEKNAYDIHLGKYASTNLSEFMAEGFAEYKLSSDPSKYAIEIGKLVDKYYKK
jgi:SPP1 gp7 family putative phage head morphogenesis protein